MSYDRAMIEAAIRNGVSIEPGEAAALLGTIDRLSAELRDARGGLTAVRAALDQAQNDAAPILLDDDAANARYDFAAALRGILREHE